MKNIKLKNSLKAGFSLVEMLVVIAIIGIIAAIAIPNIGSLNDSARDAAAKRNAQTVASVLNAAVAAGVDSTDWTTETLVTKAAAGVSTDKGAFANKTFTSGPIDIDEQPKVLGYLTWDGPNQQVKYDSTKAPVK